MSEIASEREKKAFYIGLALIIIGVILVLIVFYEGYSAYNTYELEADINTNETATILNISAEALINLLIKIAFLGIALAAGSILLSKGVQLVKQCPETGEKK